MKKLTLALVCTCLAAPFAAAEIPEKYSFAEIEGKLGTQPKKPEKIITFPQFPWRKRKALSQGVFGNIRRVDHGEDFCVRIVDYGEDISIMRQDYRVNKPGYWHFVDYGEDFCVRFVEHGEDFSIRYAR